MENQEQIEIKETDVLVIGAGPVGLFSVFQCGMLGLKCHVVDSLPDIGGQCTALYPEKPIYDIPGFPSVMGAELIQNLEAQAKPFEPVYYLGEQVCTVEKNPDGGWCVSTDKNTKIKAKAIIIAAGAGAFGPNKPPLIDIEKYEGTSVFYMVRNRAMFADKKIVIAGGGDSAVDWANSLAEIAKEVYLVHRRDKFRAAPESIKQMEANPKIEKVVPAQLKTIRGVEGCLDAVYVEDMEGHERVLEADYLLPFYGLAVSLGPIAEWDLNIDQQMISVDPASSMTNQEGIYAVGDIADYPNKLKLILTGFSEVAMAAHHIWQSLHPDEHLHQEYSTTKGVPLAGQ
jgi:thioredoxin reductase (NADPH)